MTDATAVRRTGGDLVVETLVALGARTAFGIPGQHALGLFDALGRSPIRLVSSRVENNAAFQADGFARATGEVGVLLLSTGPGALTALAGLQEAYASGVPVLAVVSQTPEDNLGGRRRGMLHQLDDQAGAARSVTRSQRTVRHHSAIPTAIAQAWQEAITAPQGPAWVEIPQDVLLAPTSIPPVTDVRAVPDELAPRAELVTEVARLLADAERPAVVAGGGAVRSGAQRPLLELAERVGAPVVCSPGGKGAFPWEHPLSLQSWVEDVAVTELLADADVLLVLGSALGEVTSNYYTLTPRGQVVQVDAEPRVLESNHPALGVVADVSLFLDALLPQLAEPAPARRQQAQERAARTRHTVAERLAAQDRSHEQRFMAAIREAVPDEMTTCWDMTIAAYWAWSCWDARQGGFHSAQGAGGLGYAFPAALGAAAGLRAQAGASSRVLAVAGDGSAMYGIAELASARQHDLPVTWLIVDDGGYGILREYMTEAFGAAEHTELSRPDFVALAGSFGVPARRVAAEQVGEALREALAAQGPNVVVVDTLLRMFAPTHLG